MMQEQGKDTTLEPVNQALSREGDGKFSYFNPPITNTIPTPGPLTLSAVFDIITGNELKEITKELRGLPTEEEQNKFKLERCPSVCFAGVFTYRNAESLQTRSGLFMLDIDKLPDTESAKQKILMTSSPALMYVTPKGHGLKVIYRIDTLKADHGTWFKTLQTYFDNKLGIPIDAACKSVAWASLLCHDEEAHFDPDAPILGEAFLREYPIIRNDIIKTKGAGSKFEPGNRNNHVFRKASQLRGAGITKEEALIFLGSFEQPGFDRAEIQRAINSAYKGNEPSAFDDLDELLSSAKIDPLADISQPPVILRYDSVPFATLGNFSLVTGKPKGRKTTFLTALVAAVCDHSPLDKLTGSLGGRDVLYIDTEQSQFHAARTIKRICRLIEKDNPANFEAYGLRRFTPAQRFAVIEHKIMKMDNLGLVIIDGVRDLLTIGINDEAGATALCSKVLKWSYDKEIHICMVLHQNKGDDNARGHIGTELVNKAETVLSVAKDLKNKAVSIVTPVYTRDLDFEPFAFTMAPDGLPYTHILETHTVKDAIHEGMTKALPGTKSLGYRELGQAYKEKAGVSLATANRHIKQAMKAGIITCSNKEYKLNTPQENE